MAWAIGQSRTIFISMSIYRSIIACSSKNNYKNKNYKNYKILKTKKQKKFLQHFLTSKLFKVIFIEFLLKMKIERFNF